MLIIGDFRPVVETTVQSTLSSTPDSTTVSYQGIPYDQKHFKNGAFLNIYTNKTTLTNIIFILKLKC